MKKLLLFLLLPLIAVAQQFNGPSDNTVNGMFPDADVTLFYGGIVGDENVPLNAVQVNDQIVIVIDIVNYLEGINKVTYAHIDLEYNKNALTLISETFKTPSDSETYIWTQNSAFTPTNNYPVHSLWDQWSSGGSYNSSTDYITKHYQSQKLGHDHGGDQGTFVELVFQVNDLPEGSDWSKVVNLTMGNLADNEYNRTYDPIAAYPNQSLDLAPRADIDLGGVTVALEFGNNTDVTNFTYTLVYEQETEQDFDGDGQPDTAWYAVDYDSQTGRPGETFPANGIADITDKLTDPSLNYGVVIEWDFNKISDFGPFFENVVTVSDYLLLFKELGQHGEGAINSGISMINADLVFPYGTVDSSDAYKILAHIMGAEHLLDNEWTVGDPMPADERWFMALNIKKEDEYITSSADNFIETDSHRGFIIPLGIDFESTAQQTIKLAGTWKGDVNLSHSAPVDQSVANSAKTVMSYGQTKKVSADDVYVDFIIEQVDNKVEATFTIPETDLAGLQFVVKYDDTRLVFDSVEFNTGNTSTNFATNHLPIVNFGSVNQDGSTIEAGTYKLIFNANNINGTTGLISVLATDGADSNANRVNIILN